MTKDIGCKFFNHGLWVSADRDEGVIFLHRSNEVLISYSEHIKNLNKYTIQHGRYI